MIHFVNLHHSGKLQKPVVININQILTIEDRINLGGGAEITLSNGDRITVSESAEQILSDI